MALLVTIPWTPLRPATAIGPTAITTSPGYQPLVPNYALFLTGISCISSILGCIGIFTTFYRFPEYRSNSRKLLLYLTISDVFTAAGNLAGVVRYYMVFKLKAIAISDCENTVLCRAQSFVTTASNLSSFFWMSVISFYFVIAIVTHDIATAERMMIPSHVICWGLPVVIVSVALGFDVLGEDLSYTSGGWCWITECHQLSNAIKITWMLVTGKFWEFSTYIILIINYAWLKYVLWKKTRYRGAMRNQGIELPGGDFLAHNDKMFVFVPIILIVLRIWGTVKFILSTGYTEVNVLNDTAYEGMEVLTVLQGIGDSGQGFWNFILFCVLTKEIRRKVFSCNRIEQNYVAFDTSSLGNHSTSSSDEEEPILGHPRSPISTLTSTTSGYNHIT